MVDQPPPVDVVTALKTQLTQQNLQGMLSFMIDRQSETQKLIALLQRHRIVGIIGARQVGKTTLARSIIQHIRIASTYYDLENPEDLARLADPMFTLKGIKEIVVIDEIQRLPELFPVLRVLVDRPKVSTRFLILGSASPDLLRQGSETLAGRIIYHELGGFSLDEVGVKHSLRLRNADYSSACVPIARHDDHRLT